MEKWLCLITGGILGTLARYVLIGSINQKMGLGFPYGTLFVNLIGCFLAGFFSVALENKFHLTPQLRVLLLVGFCGAFTTFSAFILDADHLIKYAETWKAFVYVMGSVALGFAVFRLGIFLGEIF